MSFKSLKEWNNINEGGAAIPTSKRITKEEGLAVFDWVKQNILPKLGITENDVEIIGSFGKKKAGDDHGDLDIVFDSNVFAESNNLKNDPRVLLDHMESILENMGIQTYKMVGLREISTGVQIPGTDDIAQVDFMLTPSLDWSRFIYHNPNLEKGESQYKGSYRNALIMAIISEAQKEVHQRDDSGNPSEFDYNVVRLPAGIWRTRKSYIGKRGPLKTGKILRDYDKFITTNPEEVVELIAGPGHDASELETFEKVWNLIHSPDFIYKDRLDEIVDKFKTNMEGFGIEPPQEMIDQYPDLFDSGLVKESLL